MLMGTGADTTKYTWGLPVSCPRGCCWGLRLEWVCGILMLLMVVDGGVEGWVAVVNGGKKCQ